MGGGYISCGKFLGEDKSGSAIAGVLRGIPTVLPEAEGAIFRSAIGDPLLAAVGRSQPLEIPPKLAAQLIEPLRIYHEHLRVVLGDPDPGDAPELDRERGLRMTDAKYGQGLGWQFYCTHDLLRACQLSQENNEPVSIAFD